MFLLFGGNADVVKPDGTELRLLMPEALATYYAGWWTTIRTWTTDGENINKGASITLLMSLFRVICSANADV